MVESHPLYLVCAHSSFLRPARHTGLLNLETLYSRLHAYTRSTCMHTPVSSNLLRFISASKLMAEALPAIPSKAHPLFSVGRCTSPRCTWQNRAGRGRGAGGGRGWFLIRTRACIRPARCKDEFGRRKRLGVTFVGVHTLGCKFRRVGTFMGVV